jgi:hypothetical protein
VIFEAQ